MLEGVVTCLWQPSLHRSHEEVRKHASEVGRAAAAGVEAVGRVAIKESLLARKCSVERQALCYVLLTADPQGRRKIHRLRLVTAPCLELTERAQSIAAVASQLTCGKLRGQTPGGAGLPYQPIRLLHRYLGPLGRV